MPQLTSTPTLDWHPFFRHPLSTSPGENAYVKYYTWYALEWLTQCFDRGSLAAGLSLLHR